MSSLWLEWSVANVQSGEIIRGVPEGFEFMGECAVVTGILEFYDSGVCCSTAGLEATYVEETAIDAVSKFIPGLSFGISRSTIVK